MKHKKSLFGTATAAVLTVVLCLSATPAAAAPPTYLGLFEVQSLDGSGNNPFFPTWGKAGTNYSRVAPARYADGKGVPVGGPNTRYLSNRVFNDVHQNVFSERGVSQWGFVWGQFIDHTIGLRAENGEPANIGFNGADPLETFTDDLGYIPFTRSKAAPGTGVRQQVNTVGSYIDLSAVYGDDPVRLDWLRAGTVDGNPTNNSAQLMLPGGFLPTRDSRGDPATAPTMAIDGRLLGQPNRAVVAGDVRANENIALTATQTLFAREHNRIVASLPSFLSQEDRFQIARRIVIAEQQYITYNEFLPAMGVTLPAYDGYNPFANANLSNEFATVGYRAHSQIHGEVEVATEASRYTAAQLAAIEAQGVEVEVDGAEVEFVIPLNVAFFNPDLVRSLQLGPLLAGIGAESEYRNDEQIDNQLRSVLFQVPVPGNEGCLDGPTLPQCFKGVVDLGAIDAERGRDHGMPSYNQLRKAYGLPQRTTFAAITGEASDQFPADPLLTPGNENNDPNCLDFTALFDNAGNPVPIGSANGATSAVRRCPLAARLRASYASVNDVDAFVGMVAEPHVPGTEFGELQLAIWKKQFTALRDGDRFFYDADPALPFLHDVFGLDYHVSLAQVIARNTDIPLSSLRPNVFLLN
ncbi:peroxidase family protein [Longispora sp. K20-0274]|uniref:peroxidase family protein n=1 Tax=Longispora sp. K20-0274 TaxID=3088255 RepID=UPI00399A5A2A